MSVPYFSTRPHPDAPSAQNAAWYIAELAVAALPAQRGHKHPVGEHNRDILPVFDFDNLMRRWDAALRAFGPDLNITMLTGGRSLVAVGDVDPRHGGTLDTLRQMGWPVDETVIVATGGGGWHVWAECPQTGLPSISDYGAGTEFKGDGSLVVIPWSIHPTTGNTYDYLPGHAPWEIEVAPLPDAVLADIRAHTPALQTTRLAPEGMALMHEWRDIGLSREQVRQLALKRYRKALRKVREQGEGRNNTMFWLACQLQSLGMPAVDISAWVEAFGKLVKNG